MRVVLSYSGGLDTTVSVSLLREKLGAEVITVTVDVGQDEDFASIEERALKAGSVKHYTIDSVKEFAENYISKCILMNGLYEEKYPLGTALARPLIAKKLVEIAWREGADAVAHGSTSKGNDQVRFDLTVLALDDSKKILTPVRKWMLTREWETEYARSKGLPVEEKRTVYSIDENLWSRSIEGGPLDDASSFPPEEAYKWTTSPEKAPDQPEIVDITFENGLPTSLNGKKMSLHDLVKKLNLIGGKHGVGRIDHIENRLVGLKSREVYEAPAALILIEAHKDLEKLVYTPRELRFKRLCDTTWSDLVYQGLWIEPLREELEILGTTLNRWVKGRVWVKLYKGSMIIVGREGEYSLYSKERASYDTGWYPTEEEAVGFIKLWGLHSLEAVRVRGAKLS